ncbi:DKNYY domain-containing protein [Patescibacteria group bacterium]
MKFLSRLLIASTLLLLIPQAALAGGGGWKFEDVPKDHEYFTAIDYFRTHEVVFGDMDQKDEDGNFSMTYRPDDELNRAEFATLMFRIASNERDLASSKYHDCFPDVTDEWFAPYVCWAKEKGYVSGYADGELVGNYGPAEPIKLGELSTVLSRIYEWETEEDSTWYGPSMNYGRQHNIVNETDYGTSTSRGYVAEVLYRSFTYNYVKQSIAASGSEMDLDTLEYVKNFYLKDKNSVFNVTGAILPEIDPATVEVLGDPFVKDADTVYHPFSGIAEEVDAATFEHVEGMFFKDKNSVYQAQREAYETDYFNLTDEYGLDPITFEVLYHSSPPYYPEAYVADKDNVLMIEKMASVIEEADPETFEALSDTYIRYAKDKDHIFMWGEVMEEADPDSYEVVDTYGVWHYSKDNNYVYFGNVFIAGADPNTFEVLGFGYSRDANSIFYEAFPIEDVDLGSFMYLEYGFARDKNHAYLHGGIIDDVDIATFELIGKYYYKDKDHVYNGLVMMKDDVIIEGVDPETFEYLGSYYSRDKDHVYKNYENHIIAEQFDAGSFVEYINHYAKDKDHAYYDEVIIEEADSASFEYISGLYAKDANYAYYKGQILHGEDPTYFTVSR